MAKATLTDDVLRKTVEAVIKHGDQQKAANALGIGSATVNQRLQKARKRNIKGAGFISPLANSNGGQRLHTMSAADKDRKIIFLTDETTKLRNALREAHREANTEELLREMLGHIVDAPVEQPDWTFKVPERGTGKATPEVPVSIFSDPHIGEVVQKREVNGMNEYNMAEAEKRIERYFSKLIELPTQFHTGNYPGIVVNYGGDIVSGGLHDELRKTDEDDVIPCVLKARDWIVEGFRRLADHYGRVYVPGVAGNHGRLTHRPEFKKYYKKNWDYLIFQLLKAHFQDDKRITFDFRPTNDVYYRVFNERYLLAHGDMLGVKGGDGIIGSVGPVMRGGVKQQGQSSAMGRPFDKLLIGHWHQRLWLPRAIVNNAIKGFDEYAMKALGAIPDRATQALWYVHPLLGMTAHWDIYCTKIEKQAPAEWVSWQV
jgi:hypothetical protein